MFDQRIHVYVDGIISCLALTGKLHSTAQHSTSRHMLYQGAHVSDTRLMALSAAWP
jgi:hypothetical protein